MDNQSVEAYDLPERLRGYDADMDLMHPLRWKMIERALDFLPFSSSRPLHALDLGVGTGAFTQRLLDRYPAAGAVGVDGAGAMLELAKVRLGESSERVEWVQADFLALPDSVLPPDSFDVAISSYALHHLDAEQKLALLKRVVAALKPGGWLLNADIVVAGDPDVEARIQQLRVEGVTARAGGDPRFRDPNTTRAYLDELEARERDQPQTLETDLGILREAGIAAPEVLWKEYREAVIGGARPG